MAKVLADAKVNIVALLASTAGAQGSAQGRGHRGLDAVDVDALLCKPPGQFRQRAGLVRQFDVLQGAKKAVVVLAASKAGETGGA